MEQINKFQTLTLRDFSAFTLDPFLSVHDDYFYHTQYPHKPEVRIEMCCCLLRYVLFYACALTESFVWLYSKGRRRAREILLCWTEWRVVSPRPRPNRECRRYNFHLFISDFKYFMFVLPFVIVKLVPFQIGTSESTYDFKLYILSC